MRLFGTAEAHYYCTQYTAEIGDAQGSLDAFRRARLKPRMVLREGEALFSEFRSCALREVERCLFLAASQYRRSLDLMLTSASPWAHVTLYYGSWFAAHAFLGLFGCTISGKIVIDVDSGSPGQQKLRTRKIGTGVGQQPTTYSGSHQIFWDLFYQAVAPLRPRVSPTLVVGLTPVGSDPAWQSDRRNEINYDTWLGLELAHDFQRAFAKNRFPGCLPGALATQFGVFEALLELAFDFGRQFGLGTDSLDELTPAGDLRGKVRELVYGERAPGLVSKSKKQALV